MQRSEPGGDGALPGDVAAVEVRVQSRLLGRVRDLRLVAGDRGLVLRGYSPTWYGKQLAQHAVLEQGLPLAANEIQVR